VVSDSDGYLYIVVLDMLTSLINNEIERKANTSHRIYGNFNIKGACVCVAYCERESSLFILYDNFAHHHSNNEKVRSKLAYYSLNYNELSIQSAHSIQLWD
jgi:hypothetical protein